MHILKIPDLYLNVLLTVPSCSTLKYGVKSFVISTISLWSYIHSCFSGKNLQQVSHNELENLLKKIFIPYGNREMIYFVLHLYFIKKWKCKIFFYFNFGIYIDGILNHKKLEGVICTILTFHCVWTFFILCYWNTLIYTFSSFFLSLFCNINIFFLCLSSAFTFM